MPIFFLFWGVTSGIFLDGWQYIVGRISTLKVNSTLTSSLHVHGKASSVKDFPHFPDFYSFIYFKISWYNVLWTPSIVYIRWPCSCHLSWYLIDGCDFSDFHSLYSLIAWPLLMQFKSGIKYMKRIMLVSSEVNQQRGRFWWWFILLANTFHQGPEPYCLKY